MARRKEEPPSGHQCAVGGCGLPGEHKAPKSREALHEYQWLCLDHIREFNKNWDYFKGMEPEQIETFRHDAVYGHRPTWEREDHIRKKYQAYTDVLHDEIARFFNWHKAQQAKHYHNGRRISGRERKALRTLELEDPCTLPALKSHYRGLAKHYHPDLHKGDVVREERFKEITEAYTYLTKLYQEDV